jgi:hypothetical protein
MTALDLQRRLNEARGPGGRACPPAPSHSVSRTPSQAAARYAWLIPVKDLLQAAIWFLAFMGNRIEWHGERLRLRGDGTLERLTVAG